MSKRLSHIHSLLLSTSILALAAGWANRASAVGTTLGNTTSFTVTALESYDYILISGVAIDRDVVNQGTVGLTNTPTAIIVTSGATIGATTTGSLINDTGGLITASDFGIRVDNSIITGGIVNNGVINVNGTAGIAAGIYITNTTSAITTTIANGGAINVVNTSSGVGVTAIAGGIGVFGSSGVVADVTNTGLINVTAGVLGFGTSTGALASAAGVYMSGSGGTTVDLAVVNGAATGIIDVDANALATNSSEATATANAIGVNLLGSSTTGITLGLNNAGDIDVDALADVDSFGLFGDASQASAFAAGAMLSGTSADTIDIGVTNAAGGNISVDAVADASAGGSILVFANATASAVGVDLFGADAFAINLGLANAGTIDVTADAAAAAGGGTAVANASAQAAGAVLGGGSAPSSVVLDATNSATGVIDVDAIANATGISAIAGASALGVGVFSGFAGAADLGVQNFGSIHVDATASANATAFNAFPEAGAFATGVGMGVLFVGGAATMAVTNGAAGIIDVSAVANATADAASFGSAYVTNPSSAIWGASAGALGVGLDAAFVLGLADLDLFNGGDISVDAVANANAATITKASSAGASAFAMATGANLSATKASAIDIDAVNSASGSITVNATANAVARAVGPADADASARAAGIRLYGGSADSVSLGLNNFGTIDVHAGASATATGAGTGSASAHAIVAGAVQTVSGTVASTSAVFVNNTGLITVSAGATAFGNDTATASAQAAGVVQILNGGGTLASATVLNSGTINASATASANGAVASAVGSANGILILSDNTNTLTLNIDNNGSVGARAVASAKGSTAGMFAFASGIYVQGQNVAGSIVNTGAIEVSAVAQTSGATPAGGLATAVGINVVAGEINATISNQGTIYAYAAGTSGSSNAFGIVVGATATPGGTSGDLGTIVNNGGSIIAEIANSHGTAIDVSDAPNPMLIQLMGATADGYIYGNIEMSTDDTVEVSAGRTLFDGIVNNAGGNIGTFAILSGGDLALALNETEAMGAIVNADDFDLDANGTLTLQINGAPSSYTPAPGYLAGQVNANYLNLNGGTLYVEMARDYYATNQVYEEILVQSTGSTALGTGGNVFGTTILDSTGLAGDPLLLEASVIYQVDNTADLSIDRTSFGGVAGLTPNQMAVGAGIENAYGTAGEGVDGTAFGDEIVMRLLHNFSDGEEAEYAAALDSLGGAEYAQGVQAALGSVRPYNQSVHARLSLGRHDNGPGMALAFENSYRHVDVADSGSTMNDGGSQYAQAVGAGGGKGTMSVWARGYSATGDNSGDLNAPGFDEDQIGVVAGFDYQASDEVLVGIALGYLDSDLTFDNNNTLAADGYQIGAYAGFDSGGLFLDGIVSYTLLSNDSRREVMVDGFMATAQGSWDSSVFSLSIAGGYGFDFGRATLEPYVGLDYVSVSNDAFVETGADPANLSVSDSDGTSTGASIGVRAAATFQAGENTTIVPEARVAYQYELGDDTQDATAQFDGIPTSTFTMVGSSVTEGSILAGAGVTFNIGGDLELFADYDGRFNGDYDQHVVSGGIRFKF